MTWSACAGIREIACMQVAVQARRNPILTLTSDDSAQIIGSSLMRLASPSVHVVTPGMVLGANTETTMTVTHEANPEPGAAPVLPKPKKAKKPAAEQSTPEQPAPEPSEPAKPEKRTKPKKVAKGPAPEMPLADLADHYLAHLEATKSAGTVLSYRMELDRAVSYLGAETPIGTLTTFDVARFNGSRLVMCKRDGKPKAAPSYLKTQRVLRLALVWAAEDRKWLESAPIPADAPEESEAK